jgi:hypothetical protein
VYDPNEWAKKQRAGNRLAIWIGILSICGGGVLLVLGWDVIRDQRQGPMPLKAADLAAAPKLSALPGNWVTLNPTKVRDTGVRRDLVATNGARYCTYKYSLATLDGRQLIVESHVGDKLASPLTGHLVQWEKESDVIPEIRAKDDECRDGDLLQFQLITHLGQGREFVAVMAGAGGAVLLGLLLVGAGLVGLRKASKPAPQGPLELVFRAAAGPALRPQR